MYVCVCACVHVFVCLFFLVNFSPVEIRGWGWGNPWSFPPAMNLPSTPMNSSRTCHCLSSFPRICCTPMHNLVGPHKCFCTQQVYRWEVDYIHPPFQGPPKHLSALHRRRDREKRVGRGRARINIVHVCNNYVLVDSLPPNEFGLKVGTQLTLRTQQEIHGPHVVLSICLHPS